ncbi:MAG TPA: PKD domain-containing protein, partial [Bacteroidia bacterium]|nr:PKD domain-containing protein [Bacteroidia bacterium]
VSARGDTVCVNATINLTANGGVAYSWSGPNGYASNIQNPSIPGATSNMTGVYAVTVTDARGCVNGNIAQVLINPLPVVSASSNAPCLGAALNLTSSTAVSWSWSGPNGYHSTAQNPVIPNAGSAVSGIYSVNATDVNGCVGTGTTTAVINLLPLLSINPPTSSGCAPLCVTFSNTTAATGTCNWTFGDGNTSSSCSPNHCYTGQGSLIATLTLTDNNGCTNSTTASILVFPMPKADFNATPQPTTILDSYIHFYDATTSAVPGSWYWTLGVDSATSTSSNPQHNYLEPGSYPVHMVVTSNHGCKDSTDKIIVIAEDFEIFVPNAFSPNADGTNDTFFAKGEGIKDFKMYIFDRWGAQLFFTDDIYKGWDGRYSAKGNDIVMEDVYVWKIELHTNKGDKKMLKGVVSVVK